MVDMMWNLWDMPTGMGWWMGFGGQLGSNLYP